MKGLLRVTRYMAISIVQRSDYLDLINMREFQRLCRIKHHHGAEHCVRSFSVASMKSQWQIRTPPVPNAGDAGLSACRPLPPYSMMATHCPLSLSKGSSIPSNPWGDYSTVITFWNWNSSGPCYNFKSCTLLRSPVINVRPTLTNR